MDLYALKMLRRYGQEVRQILLAKVSEALNAAYTEAEKLAEDADATDEAARLRRQHLFGKAKGIAIAAGIAAEVIGGRCGDDADNQNSKSEAEQAHLVLPPEDG